MKKCNGCYTIAAQLYWKKWQQQGTDAVFYYWKWSDAKTAGNDAGTRGVYLIDYGALS